ncbi:MAG: hypothetical protein PWQ75_191 [Methanolobus sp.]|uniref:HEAT repeat domain-containing protein n=1 Tax=Methanolobus sp. TaxID=1874737 RepID=UPI002590D4A4|nr:HEAT repeat domain-containing protein [Methanolobus sp.]MDK2830439.1 hypothetical protein [Methanolobus sp.]
MNNDIDSLMDNGDYQGILDLLKYEKVKSKILYQAETSIAKIIDTVEIGFIVENFKDENENVKQAVLYSLLEGNRNIENEEALIPLFIDFLNAKNDLIVAYSTSLLGAFKEDIVIDSLIKMLNHRYFDARICAALSLQRIGDTRAIEPLIKRLYKEKENGDNDFVSNDIIDALESFNDDYANSEVEKYLDSITPLHLREVRKTFRAYDKSNPIELYTKYLKDENEEVRKYASASFYEIRDERAKDALIEALSDTDNYVIYNSAGALGKLNTPEIIDILIKLTESNNKSIVKAAVDGLGKCLNESTRNLLINIMINKRHCGSLPALYVLDSKGFFSDKNNFDIYIKLLQHPNKHARGFAIFGLANIEERKTIDYLLYALNDDFFNNRESAATALGKIGEDAIEPLIEVLEDKNTFQNKKLLRATAKALCNIKSPKTTDALIKMTSIKDVYVRVDACIALGKIKNSKSILALKVCYYDDKHVRVQDAAKKSLRKLGIREL